ncbi:MAG: hypothetical protein KGY55_01730 [Candidatus Thermoplasmatota archaeon]|nr:hypothetical protein [Candidatus Thermoplasmatota archaeon]
MDNIEEDPVLGRFFDTPEKKARWMRRLNLAYILWIIFVIIGVVVFVALQVL